MSTAISTPSDRFEGLGHVPELQRLGGTLRKAALAALALGALLLFTAGGGPRFWGNLLIAGVNLTQVGLGGLFIVAVTRLTQARWSDPILAAPHAMPRVLPYALVVMLALWGGATILWPWARPDALADHLLALRAAWLNRPFFFLRIGIYFALWYTLGRLMLSRRLPAGPFVAIFALTFSLASFDWIMSLEPSWYSTIFAIYGFAGMFLQAIALMAISAVALRRFGLLPEGVAKAPNHDLGKLIFAFSAFWAYIWLSQFLLIWYANIPEEVMPIKTLLQGGWGPLFFLNVALNFVLPFHLMMNRRLKDDDRYLLAAALVVLAGHWLDLHLLVFPPLTGGAPPALGLPELGGILVTLGLGHLGVWPRLTRRRATQP
ncbi:MAG TPA: hypothetical protein VJ600_00720 [Holophagaceae bacterium]|nr:hypothetical protein [Holophagaceae bacterium]